MTAEPRTGGKPTITVAGQAESDLLDVLSGDALTAAVDRIGSQTRIETSIGSSGRTDQLLRRLAGDPVPQAVIDLGLSADFVADQFTTPLGDPDVDVVILSAGSDLSATHWIGGTEGVIVRPPDDTSESWSAESLQALEQNFDEAPLLSAEQYFDVTRQVISKIKAISGAHLLLLGPSTLGEGRVGTYAGIDDDHRLRAHRVNAAQIRLSMTMGVSLVDVDRVVANLGQGGQVSAPLNYSASIITGICDEIVYVLNDIGFFESRPLVSQVGRGEGR